MPFPHIDVLGSMRVGVDGAAVTMDSPTRRALLAALVVSRGELVSSDRLVDALWGDTPPDTARSTLQSHISRLRQTLGPEEVIRTEGSGYRLDLPADNVDSHRFESLTRRAGEAVPATARALFDEALDLWRGPAYGEFAERDFARAEAVRLEELRLDTTERRLALVFEGGSAGEAVAGLRALVSEAPLREGAWVLLARALGASGRHAEAIRALDEVRTNLAEIGLEPSAAVRRVEQDLLSGAAGAGDGAAATATDRLPHRHTSFVGRDGEVTDLVDRLTTAHIVTLTGAPGVGKSRLAVETGHAMARSGYETAITRLAPVTEGAVIAAMARDLEVASPTVDALVGGLRGRRLVVVVDNCDHVLDELAPIVEETSMHCPTLRFITTSRERLGIDGEQVWPVEPLDTGEGGHAVRLFADRGRASSPGFEVDDSNERQVAAVCRMLGGLPLPIEMAAAQLRALSVDEIARLLPDSLSGIGSRISVRRTGDERHRTLRATVGWTYDLLDDDRQILFDRLSCFAGSFTPEAVAAVTGGDRAAVLDGLVDLVEHSLVRIDERTGRYGMLEVIRQIGAAWLAERGEVGAMTRAHAEHYVGYAVALGSDLHGPGEPGAVDRVYAELDNLRAAHRTALSTGDVDLLARLGGVLHYFAQMHVGSETLDWALQSVETFPEPGDPRWPTLRASAAAASIDRGDLDAAIAHCRAGLSGSGGHPMARAHCYEMIGEAEIIRGDLDGAAVAVDAAIASAREAGDGFLLAMVMINRAMRLAYQGDHRGAAEAAAEVARYADEVGAPTLLAWSHYVNGEIVLDRDPDHAIAELERAQELARSVRNDFVESVSAVSISSLRARHGDPGVAVKGFAEVIRHWRTLGDWTHQWTTLRNLVDLLIRLERLEEAAVVYGGTLAAPVPTFGDEARRLSELETELRGALGDVYENSVRRGRRMPPGQLVDFALFTLDEAGDQQPPAR